MNYSTMSDSNLSVEMNMNDSIDAMRFRDWCITALNQHTLDSLNSANAAYDWERSTEDNFRSSDRHEQNYGPYKSVRDMLDTSYHSIYTRSRQWLQDSIIDSMLKRNAAKTNGNATHSMASGGESCCSCNSKEPWIVFTAGAMGAGKTHTMNKLYEQGLFPLDTFVSVDPDEIRSLMPEFQGYAARDPDCAGNMTRKEAGMLSEILTMAALERGQNVLVDGSLRDGVWYKAYFAELRRRFPNVKIGIIHVTAPTEAVFERVQSRAKITGRVVPMDVLLMSMEQVPKSMELLKTEVEVFLEIHNTGASDMSHVATKGVTWTKCSNPWKQTCAASAN